MQEPTNDVNETFAIESGGDTKDIDVCCDVCRTALLRAAWSDVQKASLLRKVAERHPSEVDQEVAIALADRLMPEFNNLEPVCHPSFESSASSRSTVGEQQFLASALDSHFDEWGEQAFRFKIYPRGWAFDLETLTQVDPLELVKSLGSTFGQIGLDEYHGALIAFVQGEFDPIRNLCRLSLSGIASRGPAKLIAKLGRFPLFRDFPWGDAFWDEDQLGDPFFGRVSVNKVHGPAHHEPQLFEADWPLCPTVLNENGKFERIEDHRGIADLPYAKILLWLDQFKPSDLTLLVGVFDNGEGVYCDSAFNGS